MIRELVLAIIAFVLSYMLLSSVRPLNPGVIAVGSKVVIPYSWDLTGPRNPLAAVTPPDAQWLRVASFEVYTGTGWLRGSPKLQGSFVGGTEYKISVTPLAIMLYPAFPVPQPAPGTVPKVSGATLVGDAFVANGFSATVIARYTPPYPYSTFPQLNYPVSELVGKPKHWSTPRVQALAKSILQRFKYATLGELLEYLTNWLRSNYRYALKYSGTPGKDAVDWFLFVSKTGMCVHFASAAAVLLNDMGIKARVVYGFANSYVQGNMRVFVTPTHMWVEVWTPGGWVPWDPSPPMSVGSGRNVERVPTAPRGNAPRAPAPVTAPNARTTAPALPPQLVYLLPFVALTLAYARGALAWFKEWPLAFRSCVERVYGVRGLTLREVAKLTGMKELERVQIEYLKKGKWPRRGAFKALVWCLSRWLRRTLSRSR